MRVVFDTNIFISALLFPGGRADEAMRRVIGGADELLISRPVIREVLSVLAEKFSRDKEELSRVAVVLAEIAELVAPSIRLDVFKDDPDNRVLECAVAGKADAIVTGDKAMLTLGGYRGIRLFSLSDDLAGRQRGNP